jgi:hypothetical protein
LNTFPQSTKTNIAPQRYIRCIQTLCVNIDSSHCWHYVSIFTGDLNYHGEAHVKTRIGKWNEIKNGVFIDKLGYIDLNAITHVEIWNTIECVLHDISYDYSVSLHYSFYFSYSVLCSVPRFSKHSDVCVYK